MRIQFWQEMVNHNGTFLMFFKWWLSQFTSSRGVILQTKPFSENKSASLWIPSPVDSAAVSIFVVILVELTNTVFVNSTNITTNIETAALSNIAHLQPNLLWNIEKSPKETQISPGRLSGCSRCPFSCEQTSLHVVPRLVAGHHVRPAVF